MGDPGDKLDRLLDAAKAKRGADEAARAAVRDQASDDGRRATSALGRYAASGWWSLVRAVGGVTVVCGVWGIVQPTSHYSITGNPYPNPMIWIAEVSAVITALMIGFIFAARAAVRKAVVREEAWLASLPFPIADHFRLLGRLSGTVAIDFEGAGPAHALFEELVAGVAAPSTSVKADFDDRQLELDISFTTNPADGGHPRWKGWHAIVDELLVPLHARFPIRAVRVR